MCFQNLFSRLILSIYPPAIKKMGDAKPAEYSVLIHEERKKLFISSAGL